MAGDYEDLCSRLESIGEELTDRAIDRLRSSLDAGGHRWPDEEKQLTRARRSIDKAIAVLRRLDESPPEPD